MSGTDPGVPSRGSAGAAESGAAESGVPAPPNVPPPNVAPPSGGQANGGQANGGLANGGSATNIQPGIDFFKKLNSEGIFNKTKVTPATVASGETPIVLDWDYLNVGNAATLKAQNITWTTSDPADGLVCGHDFHRRTASVGRRLFPPQDAARPAAEQARQQSGRGRNHRRSYPAA